MPLKTIFTYLLTLLILLTIGIGGIAKGQGAGIPTTIGWFEIPNTHLSSVAPTYPEILGSGTTGGFAAWSGCTVDNRRNMLLCHIGGHNDYYGNEIYGFDLNASPITWKLVKDASHGAQVANLGTIPSPEAFTDGSPNARHTYGGMIHLPTQDKLMLFGAFKSKDGNSTNQVWYWNPASGSASGGTGWTQAGNTGPNNASNGSIPALAYDNITDAAYEVEDNAPAFWKFDPSSATPWTLLTNTMPACNSNSSLNAVIDPINRLYICAGNGNNGPAFWKVSLNSPFTATNITAASGCSAIGAATGPGLTWYPARKTIVAWVGGNSVIEYNPLTNSCTTDTFTGGPPSPPHNDPLGNPYPTGSPQHNGTFGMFQYIPATCGFIIVNDNSLDVWHLRLDPPSTCAINDYNNRISAPGVLNSQSFDGTAIFTPVSSGFGMFPSTATNPIPTHPIGERDTIIARSGASSLRFVAPGLSDDQPNGFFLGSLGTNCGNGCTLYVSYSERQDAGYQLPMPQVNGGFTYFKNHIIAFTDGGTGLHSCDDPDLVTVNAFNQGHPTPYMRCGFDTIQHNFGGVTYDNWDHNKLVGSTLFDQGYDCPHGSSDPTICFNYPTNTWVAYLYKIQIGTFGSPNSTLSGWVSTPTSPAWRQWFYEPNHTITQTSNFTLNMIQLLSYWTSRDGTIDSGATGTHWYDEFISSTQPIQPPLAPPASGGSGGSTPTVSLSSSSIAFVPQAVSTTSAPGQLITLTNVGSASLTISSITLTGTNPGDFTITNNPCPGSLGAGLNCILTISFKPTITGARAANLTFTTNASTSPDNVSLTGTGAAVIHFLGSGVITGSGTIKNP